MYLSDVDAALAPFAKAASAYASSDLAPVSWGITYCGMYAGPGGAWGLWAGAVAGQALKAGR